MKHKFLSIVLFVLSFFVTNAQQDSLNEIKIRKELQYPKKKWMLGGTISGFYLNIKDPLPNQIKNTWGISINPRAGYFFKPHLLLWSEFSYGEYHTRLGIHHEKSIGLSLRYYPKKMILVFPIKLRIKQHYFAIRTYTELGCFLSTASPGDSFERPVIVTNRYQFGRYNAAFGINLRIKKNLFLQFAYNYAHMPESISGKNKIYGSNGIEWQF
jgi:hypothetical protein